MTFDEIKYGEVSDLVRTIELDDINFELLGIDYALRMCPHLNSNGTVNIDCADYIRQPNEWTIYLNEELEEKIQRPLLFHEVVEIYHREQGIEGTPAHNETMPWEKRFCKDYFTPSELENYLLFKKEHGYKGFNLSENNEI